MKKIILAAAAVFALAAPVALNAAEHIEIPEEEWSFNGVFGKFDQAQVQRGFQVYKDVCAACHSLRMLSYRNLVELGLTEAQVKGIAAEAQIADLNDDGAPVDRPGKLSDPFKRPYANDAAAAAANGGKAPPDLSVIVKAREGGADYIHALLTGYVPFEKLTPAQVKEFEVTKDDNYNTYFPGHKIAMPAPLVDGKVTYVDGTKSTVERMSLDVTEFLAWASEPHLEDRNRTGVRVILFLLVLAGMMYAVKRQVWADKH